MKIVAQIEKSRADNSAGVAGLVSLCMTILVSAILAPMWGTQSAVSDLQKKYNKLPRAAYIAQINQVAARKPVNIQTLIKVSDLALKMPEPATALVLATQILKKDPRNLNGLNMSAYSHDVLKEYAKAIPFREKLVEYEPWQTKNMTDLVHDYLVSNQRAKAKALAARIKELAPGSDNAKMADTLLKNY